MISARDGLKKFRKHVWAKPEYVGQMRCCQFKTRSTTWEFYGRTTQTRMGRGSHSPLNYVCGKGARVAMVQRDSTINAHTTAHNAVQSMCCGTIVSLRKDNGLCTMPLNYHNPNTKPNSNPNSNHNRSVHCSRGQHRRDRRLRLTSGQLVARSSVQMQEKSSCTHYIRSPHFVPFRTHAHTHTHTHTHYFPSN